jgi:hypothetical protein
MDFSTRSHHGPKLSRRDGLQEQIELMTLGPGTF